MHDRKPTNYESIIQLAQVTGDSKTAWRSICRQQWLDLARWLIPPLIGFALNRWFWPL